MSDLQKAAGLGTLANPSITTSAGQLNWAPSITDAASINPWSGVHPQEVYRQKEPYPDDVLGRFVVRRIENGFILHYGKYEGARKVTVYAETPQALADAIVAKLVESRLEDR